MTRQWTATDDALIEKLTSEGRTRTEVAAVLEVTKSTICGRIHRLKKGLSGRMPSPKLERIEEAKLRYENGESLNSIAKSFNLVHTTIANALRREGVQIRPRRLPLEPLTMVRPHPSAGLRPESISYFRGRISGLRSAGLHSEADALERDVTRVHELGIYFGWPLQTADAV